MFIFSFYFTTRFRCFFGRFAWLVLTFPLPSPFETKNISFSIPWLIQFSSPSQLTSFDLLFSRIIFAVRLSLSQLLSPIIIHWSITSFSEHIFFLKLFTPTSVQHPNPYPPTTTHYCLPSCKLEQDLNYFRLLNKFLQLHHIIC